MFERDYIMRLIKEVIRSILKILFNIDTDSPTTELLEETEKKETVDRLLDLIDDGEINQAENEVYELIEGGSRSDLEVALLFYSYLNDKSDEFIKENGFSREEIKLGLKTIATKYGLGNIVDMFLPEI